MPSALPPCEAHNERLATLEREQAVMSAEVKSLAETNRSEHKALRADVSEIKADIKNLTRVLTDPDTGMAGRVRRLEDAQLATAESRKTSAATVVSLIGSALAFFGMVVVGLLEFFKPSTGAP